MSEEVAQRALEPFFTTKGPGAGTGLGLSMAYGVAKAAGGDLRIDSAPGEGTPVTLYLPRVATEEAAAAPSTHSGSDERMTARCVECCWSTTIPRFARSSPTCSASKVTA